MTPGNNISSLSTLRIPACFGFRRFVLIVIIAMSVVELSCTWLSRKTYRVDKLSPTGAYRVKVDVKVEKEYDLLGGFHEWGKIQFLKGERIVDSYDWNRKDNFEFTFMEANPVIEWVEDNVLRMGQSQKGIAVPDEIIISNSSRENLKYLHISCSKSEQISVLDLAPAADLALHTTPISPWHEMNGSLRYSLGYGGTSETGKKFSGVVESDQRTVLVSGSARFQIVIKQEDLQ